MDSWILRLQINETLCRLCNGRQKKLMLSSSPSKSLGVLKPFSFYLFGVIILTTVGLIQWNLKFSERTLFLSWEQKLLSIIWRLACTWRSCCCSLNIAVISAKNRLLILPYTSSRLRRPCLMFQKLKKRIVPTGNKHRKSFSTGPNSAVIQTGWRCTYEC